MRREGEIEYSMNVAFAALTLLSLVMMTFAAPADMLPSMISGVSGAIVLILKLTAVYAVWLSVLKMAEATGLDRKLSRALRPVIRRLFKGESEKSYDYISVNTKLPKVYRLDAPPEVLSTDGTPAKTPLLAGDMDDVPYKERLIHRTSFGLAVRSKSEALIAEVLHAAGVVFAYELPLTLFDGDKAVFVRPDFTITARDGCRIYL